MSQLVQSLPEFSNSLSDELEAISQEYGMGTLAQEFAFLRMARLVIEDRYSGPEIIDRTSGGKISFPTMEDFVKYVCNVNNISRMTVFNRLRAYRRLVLEFGKDYKQAFRIILHAPGIVESLKEIAKFSDDGRITELKTDKAMALVSYSKRPDYAELVCGDDEVEKRAAIIEAISVLLDEVVQTSNRKEARQLVDKILVKDTVRYFKGEDGAFVAECTQRSVDKDGVVYDESPLEIEWVPKDSVPEWVTLKLYSQLRAGDNDV